MKAIWNNKVVAESGDTVVVEGNHYFPADSVAPEMLEPSEKTTFCPWKGEANYMTLVVDGKKNPDAVWVYRTPKSAAANIKGRLAFWAGVEVTD